MKAAFALLANVEVHNFVRRLAWGIHEKYHTGTIDARLPPHISLKQPFGISNLDPLEEYMDELAKSIHPFDVTLTELQLVPIPFEGTEFGLLWIDVQETNDLHRLHDRLNAELTQRFGNTQADFDGAVYHFHMTVMMGGQPMDVYRKFYNELPETNVNLRYTIRELAMFVYDEPMRPQGEYLTYKILPIGK
jgi:2'-5' RNA ligase